MLTKEKAMYQTWLIIDGLSDDERKLISEDLIEEIKNNMEVDESIKIDFSIPLEKQKLDSKTWKMLDRVIKNAEKNGFSKKQEIDAPKYEIMSNANELEKIKLENIALSKELDKFRDESRELTLKYKEAYEKTLEENKKIKKDCEDLIETLKSIPKFIRRIFLKDEKVKLLISGRR